MGTRFLLTSDSPVGASVKARYLAASVTDTVVTSALDGVPQRVLRTPAVDRLAGRSGLRRLAGAARSAAGLRPVTAAKWRGLAREGLVVRRPDGPRPAAVLPAANTPEATRGAR